MSLLCWLGHPRLRGRFGSAVSNRSRFANNFLPLGLTTMLIITIVQSSIALSLGLVGALSIVRFRTPIKEPEELAYLFVSIAIGLGLGANLTMITVAAAVFILTVMALLKFAKGQANEKRLFLSLDWMSPEADSNDQMEKINSVIGKHIPNMDLRRFDVRDNVVAATYMLDSADAESMNRLVTDLRNDFPNIGVTFLDQNQLPGI